jgi:HAMP domain-containing protein
MGLRMKFNLVLIFSSLLGAALATFLSYEAARKNAIAEIEQEIDIIRANALAVRSYTSKGIGPLLGDDRDILFIPHSVPSFSAQSVFANFQQRFPNYYYKEAALNPTNPDDLAEDWEADLIEQLRADESLEHVAVVRETDAGKFYTVAFPMAVKSESCLRCHSDPSVAPAAMLDLYGDENGFGWKMNEVVAAQIIYAPMSLAEDRALSMVIVLAQSLGLAFLLVLVVTNLLLSRIVISPVKAMSDIAEKVSLGDFSPDDYVRSGKDEISSLSQSFNRMRRSLESAMKLLDD